ncbi:unnamed protein product, partial [Pylaiella littoralis]
MRTGVCRTARMPPPVGYDIGQATEGQRVGRKRYTLWLSARQEDHIARSDVWRRVFRRWWKRRRHGRDPQHQLYTRPNGHDQGAFRDCQCNSDRQCNSGRHSSSISGRASCGYLYSN